MERSTSRRLRDRDIQSYVPVFGEAHLLRDYLVPRVMFPGYAFVWARNRWQDVLSTPGVIDFVREGNSPALPGSQLALARFIKHLRARESKDGMVRLDTRFQVGDQVRAEGGTELFIVQGYSDYQRVRVLLNILGRQIEMRLPERDLVAA